MKRVLKYSIIFVIAVIVGLLLKSGPGYLLLAYQRWTLEMPLWFAVIAIILLFFLVHWGWRVWSLIKTSPERWFLWRERHHFKKSYSKTGKGMIALAEGYWNNAEKLLIQGIKKSHIPIINYLYAAKAAQHQNSIDRRDSYLQQAHECAPENEIAIGLMQAKLQYEYGQDELALATLQHLYELVPEHPFVLELLKDTYLRLKDWNSLLELMPKFMRYGVEQGETLADLMTRTYYELLEKYRHSLNKLKSLWESMPRKISHKKEIIKIYCRAIAELGESKKALKLLTTRLNREWDEELCDLFGVIVGDDAKKQLKTMQGWQREHDNSAALLKGLGNVAIRCGEWRLAEEYLNKSLGLQESIETQFALAYVYEKLGEVKKALAIYQQSASW